MTIGVKSFGYHLKIRHFLRLVKELNLDRRNDDFVCCQDKTVGGLLAAAYNPNNSVALAEVISATISMETSCTSEILSAIKCK